MLDLEGYEHLLDGFMDPLSDLSELYLALILLVEFCLKIVIPNVSELHTLAVVHHCEMRLIGAERGLVHLEEVVAVAGVELLVDIDLKGKHTLYKHYKAHVELLTTEETRVLYVLLCNLRS